MNGQTLSLVLLVVGSHFLALLSPGPDFVLIVKSGVRNPLPTAFGVVCGIVSANAIYISLCILGLGELVAGNAALMNMVRAGGGGFLLYLAISALKTSKTSYLAVDVDSKVGNAHSTSRFTRELVAGLVSGLVSGLSNPKNLVFYLSLFSLVLAGDSTTGLKLLLGGWMTLDVLIWDSFVLLSLSVPFFRRWIRTRLFYIDKITGTVIGLIGLHLLYSAFLG